MTDKTLLAIHACGIAEPVVSRHWKSYKLSGCNIIGIDTIEHPFAWPEGCRSVKIGHDRYLKNGVIEDISNLPTRLVETLEFCLEDNNVPEWNDVMITEYDSMFFKPVPKHPGGLVTTLAGYCPKRWNVKSTTFLHPPWWFDRETASLMAKQGRIEINNRYYENGGPDVFLGYLCDVIGVKLKTMNTWSTNSRDLRVKMDEAIAAKKSGAFMIHGVAEKDQFERLLTA